MPGAGVRLLRGASLRPASDADTPFFASLHHSTRNELCSLSVRDSLSPHDDVRSLSDRDRAEPLTERQSPAQAEGGGAVFPAAMYFRVGLRDDRIGRLLLDVSQGAEPVIAMSFSSAASEPSTASGRGSGHALNQMQQTVAKQISSPVLLNIAMDHARRYAGFGCRLEGQSSPAYARLLRSPTPARRTGSSAPDHCSHGLRRASHFRVPARDVESVSSAVPDTVKVPLGAAGQGLPHGNRQPVPGLSFCIALQGIFSSRLKA